MRQLYVCSRPLLDHDGTMHRHLIGILSQTDDRKFSFQYRLDDSIDSNRLILQIFPYKNKIYTDRETRVLLDDYLPSENDTAFIASIVKRLGLPRYDEWAWLTSFESDDIDAETCLLETLTDDIIRHDLTLDNDKYGEEPEHGDDPDYDYDDDDEYYEDNLDDDEEYYDEPDEYEDYEPDEDEYISDDDFDEDDPYEENDVTIETPDKTEPIMDLEFDPDDESLFNDAILLESDNDFDDNAETESDNSNNTQETGTDSTYYDDYYGDDDYYNDDYEDDDDEQYIDENVDISPEENSSNNYEDIKKTSPVAITKKPSYSRKTTVIKTIVHKTPVNETDDFISPPPMSPLDLIQQRLLDNQEQRRKALEQEIRNNPYKQ